LPDEFVASVREGLEREHQTNPNGPL